MATGCNFALGKTGQIEGCDRQKSYFETARTVSLCFAFEFGDLHGCSDPLEKTPSRSSMMNLAARGLLGEFDVVSV